MAPCGGAGGGGGREGTNAQQTVVCSPAARSPRGPGVCVTGDVGCWGQVSSPLPPLSPVPSPAARGSSKACGQCWQQPPPPPPARDFARAESGGRSRQPGCCGGQGQCPRWTSTAHMPPRSPVSCQRGPRAPPALRGLRVAPHALAGLGQVQQHRHLTLCGHRRGSAVACPGAGDLVGGVSPRAQAAVGMQPPLPEAQTLVHFLGHTGACCSSPTSRRGLGSQLPLRGGGLLRPLKQGPGRNWSTWVRA